MGRSVSKTIWFSRGAGMYIKKVILDLRKSKPSYSIFYAILLELIFYGIMIFTIMYIFPRYIIPQAGMLLARITQFNMIPDNFPDAPSVNAAGFTLIFYVFLFIVGISLIHALTKGQIWYMARSKVHNFRTFLKQILHRFVLFNIILTLAYIIVFYLGFYTLFEDIFSLFVLFVLLPVFAHYATVSYVIIGTKNWIKRSFHIAFKRIHHLLLPYLIIISFGVMLFFLLAILSYITRFVSQRFFFFIVMLVFIAYSAWSKFYLARVIGGIK